MANPGNSISAGLTTEIALKIDEVEAIALSPGLLILHDDGRLGVRYVDTQDVIQFAAVEVIDDASNKVWVTGLPNPARLVSVGQEFVTEGTLVTPVDVHEAVER